MQVCIVCLLPLFMLPLCNYIPEIWDKVAVSSPPLLACSLHTLELNCPISDHGPTGITCGHCPVLRLRSRMRPPRTLSSCTWKGSSRQLRSLPFRLFGLSLLIPETGHLLLVQYPRTLSLLMLYPCIYAHARILCRLLSIVCLAWSTSLRTERQWHAHTSLRPKR